ncbi:auxin response factor 5-like protein [Tanacetum coccineum]
MKPATTCQNRAFPSKFVIPLARYRKSVYGTQLFIGMRVGMMFQTGESGKCRYMGTIVEWDKPGYGDKQSRVSPLDIEAPERWMLVGSVLMTCKKNDVYNVTPPNEAWTEYVS